MGAQARGALDQQVFVKSEGYSISGAKKVAAWFRGGG